MKQQTAMKLILLLSVTLIWAQLEIAFGQWADGQKDVVFRDTKAKEL